MSSFRRAGFTLLEMLAVMLLVGIVMTLVVNFQRNLSRESSAAAEGLRQDRRTIAALDRIAEELEASLLVVRPGEVDPLDFPWVFYAENRGGGRGDGADRMRFVTWDHHPRAGALRESDLQVVAYGLRQDASGDVELMRWSEPHLPDKLEREVPVDPDKGAQVLVDGVSEFGVQFLTQTGDWQDNWDSSQVVESNLLPVAAKIHLALTAPDAETPSIPLEREVVLELRPLDLQKLLTPKAGTGPIGDQTTGEGTNDEQSKGPCITVDQCRQMHPEVDLSGVDPTVLESVGSQCAREVAAFFSVPGDCQ